MPSASRALSAPRAWASQVNAAPWKRPRRATISLPRMGGFSVARRSITVAGAAASSVATNVSAAASIVASNASATAGTVASSVSATMSTSVAAFAAVATGGSGMHRRYSEEGGCTSVGFSSGFRRRQLRLPALPERPSVKLPQLALEGPEVLRPSLCLHNVGLIRLIFEEARTSHSARPSYQARQIDPASTDKRMHGVIFREVCTDVLRATQKCCKAYRAVEVLGEAADRRMASRNRVTRNIQNVRRKLLVAGILCKTLRNMREDTAKAESMWKQCCAGLGSLSLSSKAFASRSVGLRSFRPGAHPCGSISLGLRSCRRSAKSSDKDCAPDIFPGIL